VLSHNLAVVFEVTVKGLDLLLVYNKQTVAQSVEEVLIVRHNNKTTLKVVERNNQSIDSIEIQMISRLIQHQDVRLFPSNDRKRNARLLSSGKQIHRAQSQVVTDTKRTEMLTELFGRYVGVTSHHLLNSRHLQVETIHVMLSENTNAKTVVNETVTITNLEFSTKGLHEGGLTSTVGTDKRNTSVQVNVDVHLLQNVMRRIVTNVGLIEAHKWGRNLFRVGEHENDVRVLNDISDQINLLDGLDTRLDKSSTLGVESELVNELLDVGNLVCLSGLGRFLILCPVILCFLESIEITLVVGEFHSLEVDDFITGRV
jgi:hypothetical protein